MLVEFTVGNFRSIAEKVTLSMIAAPIKSGPHAIHLDAQNLIPIDDKLSLLKTVAIYGANASGKSNILTALVAMGRFMEESVRDSEKNTRVKSVWSPVQPFLLIDKYREQPSHFEIVFLIQGTQYRYGFEVSDAGVEKEWLFFAPHSREARLFEREKQSVEIGSYFKGAKGLKSRLNDNALFLTVARDFNVKLAKEVFNWTDSFFSLSGLSDRDSMYTIQCLEEKNYHTEIIDFIKRLDVGISDIELEQMIQEDHENKKRRTLYAVETIHKSTDISEASKDIRFNLLFHESAGTQKIFSLSGIIVNALKRGDILAIDEMDAKLHPALTRKIVEMFNSSETNPNKAQLIFATHDTNLLDNQLFRRDQIWFAEKKRNGATDLYSLVELKVRNDAQYEKDYIEGRYGAIPFPGGFENLFSSEASNAE